MFYIKTLTNLIKIHMNRSGQIRTDVQGKF